MQSANSSAYRYDIYAIIHKALRRFMFDTVSAVGGLDDEDDAAVAAAVAQVRELAHLCRIHLDKENHFVHPAMEARVPASTAFIAADHVQHEREIDELFALADTVDGAAGALRQRALRTLYRQLALFTGHNMLHMEHEETEHNAVLWSAYSDAELTVLEQSIVAAIAPEDKMPVLRCLLVGMNRQERAAMLADMRDHAPAPVFAGVLELAAATLAPAEHHKLLADLDMHTLKAA